MAQDTVVLPIDTLEVKDITEEIESVTDTVLTKRISNSLIDLIRKESPNESGQKDFSFGSSQFVDYEDMIITDIRIVRLQPFGPTLKEPDKKAVSFFERTANKLHFRTQESIIKNSLLFDVGEKLDPYTIADNERFLRTFPYIEDARIIVSEVSGSDHEVEIIILTKDVYPYGFSFAIPSVDKGNVDIWNNNIFGYGHIFKNTIYWNNDYNTPMGYYMQYRIKNVASTFTDAEFQYTDRFGNKGYRINLSRPFYSPEAKYAGGFSFENMQEYKSYWTFDTTYYNAFSSYYRLDGWAAHAIRINPSEKISKYRTSIVVSARMLRDFHFESPDFVREQAFHKLQSRNLYLANISFIRQNFIKTNFIYSFGRTEDLPYGYNLTFTTGYESSTFNNRPYLGFQASAGKYHYRLGYLYGLVQTGTFIENNLHEQAVLHIEGLYFSHLFGKNKYRYRIFKRFDFTKAYRPFVNDHLSIERRDGIRGLRSNNLRGTERLTASLESVLFTPWKPLDFRIALFAFTDWGIVNNEKKQLFENEIYQNIGIGVRFRNENLVFNTIELRLTYFLNTPLDASTQHYQFLGEPRLRPNTFYSQKPSVVELQ
jgi:hypothetical protein